MKKYIIIKADTNDADYVTSEQQINDSQLNVLKPIIEVIKSVKGYNWETGEMEDGHTPKELYIDTGLLTQKQVDLIDIYIPHGEYGIHTIESIKVLTILEEEELL
jgi:hypothetical protein